VGTMKKFVLENPNKIIHLRSHKKADAFLEKLIRENNPTVL
jgi:hypothetical protein